VPSIFRKTFLDDQIYVEGLVANRRINPDVENGLSVGNKSKEDREPSARESEAGSSGKARWREKCSEKLCSGDLAWTRESETAPAGTDGRWAKHLILEYHFAAGLDAARREVFRKAVEVWQEQTCLVFEEKPNLTTLQVEATDVGTCTHVVEDVPAAPSGAARLHKVNLGSCKDMGHLGNVLHQVGHVLGLQDEQKRLDAAKAYHGHGPFLVLHWQNILPDTTLFEESEAAYMGSADDGDGDTHIGYSPYDFESIMHAQASGRFETVPPGKMQLVGQRQRPSAGDISKIKDMYQCKARDAVKVSCGACGVEGDYYEAGQTASTAPVYVHYSTPAGGPWIPQRFLYFDPNCDDAVAGARWIIGGGEPSRTKAQDLDGDRDCDAVLAYVRGSSLSVPRNKVWQVQREGGPRSKGRSQRAFSSVRLAIRQTPGEDDIEDKDLTGFYIAAGIFVVLVAMVCTFFCVFRCKKHPFS